MEDARRAKKILVLHTAFLGDLVLSSAFLANLRALAPEAEIRFLTTPAGARLFTPNDFGVKPVAYDKRGKDKGFSGFLRFARALRDFAPDLVFCLHRSLRSALLAKVAGGTIYGFREAAGSVLFHHRVGRPAGLFEAEKNQRVLVAWAGERAAKQPVFPRLAVASSDEAEAEDLLRPLAGKPFVALAPSSVWATKRWPAGHFARLAGLLQERHGLPVVLVGGREAEDLECAAKVEELAPRGTVLNLCGKTGLGSLKSVLSRAKLVVANDSSPLHVGIAMGAPVVGVFGPTTRELGFFPNAPAGKAAVAEVAELDCRPCGLHGHHRCPKEHFRCMLDLSPEQVLKETEKLLCP